MTAYYHGRCPEAVREINMIILYHFRKLLKFHLRLSEAFKRNIFLMFVIWARLNFAYVAYLDFVCLGGLQD